MYEKTNKRRLYWLIDMYLYGKIDASTFCDEYYYCHDQELDRDKVLNAKEQQAFEELSTVAGRFSPYKEDHSFLYTEEQLKQTVIDTKEVLKVEWPVEEELSKEKTGKKELYSLIDTYLKGKITASIFRDQFYHYYLCELNLTILTQKEAEAFIGLNRVVKKFSPYEQDYKSEPKIFLTEEHLKQTVIETKEALKDESPD